MNRNSIDRRGFLKTLGVGAALGATTSPNLKAMGKASEKKISPNDKVRIASIGMGIIAFENMGVLARMPEAEFVAAADCYTGRLSRTREVFGKEIAITQNYKELLERKDIDAVIINTPDHWHGQIAVDAMNAGKAVYIEKPVIQKIEDGHRIIQAEKETGQVTIVGSKQFRQPLYQKARELIASGEIGQLTAVEAVVSRNSGIGAWQYSIPTDANEKTIDWKMFLGPAPDRPFDADRFFRWRKYWDYGTGVSGDMFVHRLSALHYILDSKGPTQISAMGGVRYWNDNREAPDILMALLDYPPTSSHPSFTLILKANFADGSGGGPGYRFIGSEGVMEIGWRSLTVKRNPRGKSTEQQIVEGYNSVRTFSKEQQDEFVKEYRKYKSQSKMGTETRNSYEMEHKGPDDYDSGTDHFGRFLAAVKGNNDIIQDATYGLRAAAPSIIPNYCMQEGKVYNWDPYAMKIL